MAAEEAGWPGDSGDGGYSPSELGAGGAPFGLLSEEGVAMPVNLADDEGFWDHRPVQPGCILEVPVSRDTIDGHEDATMAVFVMAATYAPTGCWVKCKLLGGSTEWAKAHGIRVVSRERQGLHLCYGGRERCKELAKKGQHIGSFGVYLPGAGCPNYVEKAKKREWKKLYQEAMGGPPGSARGAGEEQREAPLEADTQLDRISALRKRLQARSEPEKKDDARGTRRLSPPRVAFSPVPRPIEDAPPQKKNKEKEPAEEEREQKKERGRKPRSVGQALAEVAVAQGRKSRGSKKKGSSGSSSSSGGSRSRSRHRSKKKKRKRDRRKRKDSRSSSGEETSSSSSLVPPLQRKANREPGSVMRMLFQSVSEALAEAAVGGEAERSYLGGKGNQLSSYFQIVARPQMAGKVRDLRELETIARCLDYLKLGRLADVGDALAGRFMAVEAAALANSWQDAQHLEVVPAHHSGVTSPAVLLRAQRHAKQVEKATGRPGWKRPPYQGGDHAGPPRADGGTPRPKGKGDGKGKGGGAKGGKGGGAWKDRDKEKPDGSAGAK